MRRLRTLRLFVIALTTLAGPLHAQQVQLRGYGEADLDAWLRSALAAHPLIVTHDTLVRAGDTVRSNVVVIKARFILEGAIVGDLTGIAANVYLRPPARVSGQVTNIAGGLYMSELARTGAVEDRPLAPYSVERNGDTYVVQGQVRRPALSLLGGVRLPEYNRVDGLRVEAGPSILLPPMAGVEPTITASLGYATERKDLISRAQLKLKRGLSTLSFGLANNITMTNEDWIRPALNNSVAVIWNGHDYRNYYEADISYIEFRRVLERGARTSEYWIRGQDERASALVTGDPFIILKPDSLRFNDPVPSSRITSAFVGARTTWTGTSSVGAVQAELEFAGKNGTKSDYAFNAYRVSAEYAMKALANHTLHIKANLRGPFWGTRSLPQQRWTFVGGANTLYTFRLDEFRGDRLAFVQS